MATGARSSESFITTLSSSIISDLKATPQNGYESLALGCGSSAVGWHGRAALGGLGSNRVLSKQQAVITAPVPVYPPTYLQFSFSIPTL